MNWFTQKVQLEEEKRSSFQLHLQTSHPTRNLRDADGFCRNLPQSYAMEIVANRDGMQALDDVVWKRACKAIGKSGIKSFGYSTMFCRSGLEDESKMRMLLTQTTALETLSIQDGIYAYTKTFAVIGKLQQLEKLVLKDSAFGSVVDLKTCQALASCIRSLPKLRSFSLWSAVFESREAFDVIVEALTEKIDLEEVSFFRLRTADDKNNDFAREAEQHPFFVENRAIMEYLKTNFTSCFTLSQRLEATLHVRTKGQLQLADARQPESMLAAMSTIGDCTSLCFQMLRQETDPSAWAAVY